MLISVNYKNQMADQNNMNMEHEQFDYDFDTLSMVSDDSGYYTIPFLPFNPVLPGVSPHPDHEQNLWTLEQKLNLNFRCWIKSSMNLRIIFNRIRRASNSSSKTPKDKRPNGPNWTRQKRARTKTVRKLKTDRKWCIIRSITYLNSIFSWVKNSYQSFESYLMAHYFNLFNLLLLMGRSRVRMATIVLVCPSHVTHCTYKYMLV